MKKKLLTALLVGAMTLNITACGGSSDAAAPADNDQQTTTTDTAADDAADTEEDAVDVEDAAEAADTTEEEGFSLLDVTADLVDAALYAVDDDNTEYVITLFRDPDGYSYVSLMIVPQDGQGDVLCGAYDDSNVTNVTDEDNIDWTEISTTDVYTGDDFSAVFVEADDGSVAIANSDFSLVMEGQYLTADEAIAYMGAAANYIN
ncbi:hypothetical protein DW654_15315 [Roseburia inulinivorans]|jgi:uncharacterized low-complexity protein|uniref:Uncharacterized protein n=1 Tax=Roseburia inulinivorans TaxID=360807 RepID=A0A3R6D2A4_9FIRM|nr:hypothetical protein [Roseburia inulinivorans]RHF81561.1 hypothetical protein DW654_15315 [Roseburia inulinivorans]